MENIGSAMQRLMERFMYVVEIPCPECGGEMIAWKEKEGVPPRCAPVCVSCGHKSLKKTEAISTQDMYENSLKNKAINYMKHGSVITDKSLWECTLDNFKEMDEETSKGKQLAERAVEDILNGNKIHVIFSGKTGAGKSHLSVAILQDVLAKSNYNKKCLYINYRELLEQLKFAMNDEQTRKQITGSVMKELKLADLVVIDDLGAELGSVGKPERAKTFNIDTISSIMEARQDKATIITTNLTGKMINELYGDRVISRIMDQSHGYAMSFTRTADKRMKQLV